MIDLKFKSGESTPPLFARTCDFGKLALAEFRRLVGG
jgi:hypothetical protein